jgi:hypothetical protein
MQINQVRRSTTISHAGIGQDYFFDEAKNPAVF